jgi:NADH dehydrogenase
MAGGMITVFGGSGFLGRHVVRRLAQAGNRITVAVRHPEHAKFLKPMGDVGQITALSADIKDAGQVAAAVAGADGVVNLVGILYQTRRQRFDAIHALGAERVAKAAAAAGVKRVVQISAIGANADSDSEYARTKAAGEAAVRAAFPGATVIRPSIIFGPDDDFFNRFAQVACVSLALPLFGGGVTRYQPVYVGDAAEAIAKVMESEDAKGKTFELAGPKVYSFAELMELMLAEIGRKRLLVPLPFFMADIMGAVLQYVPPLIVKGPILTRDQAQLLRHDSVASATLPGLEQLAITPTSLEIILPSYLDRFRRGGRFGPAQK